MNKKDYQKPMTEVIEADVESQILAGSPYSMQTTGGREQLSDGTSELGWDEE